MTICSNPFSLTFASIRTNNSSQFFFSKTIESLNDLAKLRIVCAEKLKNTIVVKIYIRKCSKDLLKKIRIDQISSIESVEVCSSKMNCINKSIDTLENSGYVKSSLIRRQSDLIIFDLRMNPILKKIKIKACKNLKIHRKLLEVFFRNQVGLPRNNKLIQESINEISKWYTKKGYEWIAIRIISNRKLNELQVHINEGLIDKVNMICETKKLKKNLSEVNNLIAEKLKIFPQAVLNLRTLERGVSFFEKQKIVNNINYRIRNSKKGLVVNIRYSLSDNSLNCYHCMSIFKLSEFRQAKLMRKIIDFPLSFYRDERLPDATIETYQICRSCAWLEITQERIWKSIQRTRICLHTSIISPSIRFELSDLKVKSLLNSYILHQKNIVGWHNYRGYKLPETINSSEYLQNICNLKKIIQFITNEVRYSIKEYVNVIQEITVRKSEKKFNCLNDKMCKTSILHCHNNSLVLRNKATKDNYCRALINFSYQTCKSVAKYESRISAVLHDVLFSNFYINNLKLKNLKRYAGKNINFTYRPVINLPAIIPNISKDNLLLNLEINLLTTSQNLLDLEIYSKHESLMSISKKSNSEITYSHWIARGEYKVCILRYIEPCISLTYIKGFFYEITDLNNLWVIKNLHKNIFKVHLGIKFIRL